jgi:hypothetical protein
MHVGYQLSNILESAASIHSSMIEAVCLCHNSLFDLYLSLCDIDLNNYDVNNKKFLENNKIISTWSHDNLIKSYNAHIVNNPLAYLKNNNSLHLHLNSVVFSHDIGLLSIKKEDAFLLCSNAFRTNDVLIYFNPIMANYNCPKIEKIKLDYSIPDDIKDLKQERQGVAIFCYNKNIGQDLINSISPNSDQLSVLPNSLEELNNELNKYELFVELDSGSIINALSAIASGGVAVILDPNNILSEYRKIPNLYVVNSLPELQALVSKRPERTQETTIFNSNFRDFDSFKKKIFNTIKESQRKAFIL